MGNKWDKRRVNKVLARLRESELTYQQIGDLHGVSRQRVGKIARDHGLARARRYSWLCPVCYTTRCGC